MDMTQEARAAEAEAVATIKADMAKRAIARAIPRHRFTKRAALLCGHNRLAFVASDAAHMRERPVEHDDA